MLDVGADIPVMRRLMETIKIKLLPWNDREQELKAEIEDLKDAVRPEAGSCKAVYTELIDAGE